MVGALENHDANRVLTQEAIAGLTLGFDEVERMDEQVGWLAKWPDASSGWMRCSVADRG